MDLSWIDKILHTIGTGIDIITSIIPWPIILILGTLLSVLIILAGYRGLGG